MFTGFHPQLSGLERLREKVQCTLQKLLQATFTYIYISYPFSPAGKLGLEGTAQEKLGLLAALLPDDVCLKILTGLKESDIMGITASECKVANLKEATMYYVYWITEGITIGDGSKSEPKPGTSNLVFAKVGKS